MAMNRVIVHGLVGNMHELKSLGENNAVINFSVATSQRRFNEATKEWEDGGTIWTSLTAWGKVAEDIAEHVKVGDVVLVDAHMTYKAKYTNKEGVEVPESVSFTVDDFGIRPRKGDSITRDRKTKSVSENTSKPAPKKKDENKGSDLTFDVFDDTSKSSGDDVFSMFDDEDDLI